MSLEETIKELKEQLAEVEAAEAKELEAPEAEDEAAADPEVEGAEPEKEEKPEEPEAPAAEEEKPDNASFARLRRELAAAKKLLAEREAPKAAVEDTAAEQPDIAPELTELLTEHRTSKAEREFIALENQYKRHNPEYADVAAQYAEAIAQSIRIQNPRLSQEQIIEQTKKTVLTKASQYYNQGFDPIDELHQEAKELGFKPRKAEKEEVKEEKEDLKPDMDKLAKNRKKSAGMAASSGKSEGILTKQAAAELSPAEWSKLPKEEKRRLLQA